MKISYKSNINDAINEILRHFLLILPLKMKVELFIARKLKLGNGKVGIAQPQCCHHWHRTCHTHHDSFGGHRIRIQERNHP